jgi:hypothetical protein
MPPLLSRLFPCFRITLRAPIQEMLYELSLWGHGVGLGLRNTASSDNTATTRHLETILRKSPLRPCSWIISRRVQEHSRRAQEPPRMHQERPRDPKSAPGEFLRPQECTRRAPETAGVHQECTTRDSEIPEVHQEESETSGVHQVSPRDPRSARGEHVRPETLGVHQESP